MPRITVVLSLAQYPNLFHETYVSFKKREVGPVKRRNVFIESHLTKQQRHNVDIHGYPYRHPFLSYGEQFEPNCGSWLFFQKGVRWKATYNNYWKVHPQNTPLHLTQTCWTKLSRQSVVKEILCSWKSRPWSEVAQHTSTKALFQPTARKHHVVWTSSAIIYGQAFVLIVSPLHASDAIFLRADNSAK